MWSDIPYNSLTQGGDVNGLATFVSALRAHCPPFISLKITKSQWRNVLGIIGTRNLMELFLSSPWAQNGWLRFLYAERRARTTWDVHDQNVTQILTGGRNIWTRTWKSCSPICKSDFDSRDTFGMKLASGCLVCHVASCAWNCLQFDVTFVTLALDPFSAH